MGLFNRKSMQERQADAMKMADNIADGRGFVGKMSKAFIGSEAADALKGATTSMHEAQDVAALRASGAPTETATVTGLQDTGQSINDNPIVILTLELAGQQVTVQGLVSRLEIPRVGEQVLVMRDPQNDSLRYVGLAPRV